ncbi:DUF3152 domain-containing protein [Streptomyces tsukubensis]|uniref:DUF3152 domain-containing protein n=1 Tax=Streptomyces tsukubensis TaxID=83656 RepID=A0A1V4ACM9_9ACTN|nr:DUF3152 domain-containing protein [Streptomyces tsukubensis]OON81282.1 hypothetical protein B1H18_07960 [Streptomyces tsukubensis]QFR95605.1 DUF3152 domain-containing protein [Streptomyces tsukubensis]
MGRHSRPQPSGKSSTGPAGAGTGRDEDPAGQAEGTGGTSTGTPAYVPGPGRRRRSASAGRAGEAPSGAPGPGTSSPAPSGSSPFGGPGAGPASGTGPASDAQSRGGHPEQHEPGGGWGSGEGPRTNSGPAKGSAVPRVGAAPGVAGPRKEYLEAFDSAPPEAHPTGRGGATRSARSGDGPGRPGEEDLFRPRVPGPRAVLPGTESSAGRAPERDASGTTAASGTGAASGTATVSGAAARKSVPVQGRPKGPGGPEGPSEEAGRPAVTPQGPPVYWDSERDGPLVPEGPEPPATAFRWTKGRTVTGGLAAVLTVALAVFVAGEVSDSHSGGDTAHAASGAQSGKGGRFGTRSDERPTPPAEESAPPTYDEKMAKKIPMAADLEASGKFETMTGADKAPSRGRQALRYRVDVEKGLHLDGGLFTEAVQKTLNDKRSWAHDNARSFERISSGKPDFVITLASPGTTAVWCAKSGLDTTEDNVSCDSAATERVMINAYRWAEGSKTYGDAIHPYRQMLINHEVGHRLGYNHVTCSNDGALAPVMQQQTKFLTYNGITCRPNPWAFPHN